MSKCKKAERILKKWDKAKTQDELEKIADEWSEHLKECDQCGLEAYDEPEPITWW